MASPSSESRQPSPVALGVSSGGVAKKLPAPARGRRPANHKGPVEYEPRGADDAAYRFVNLSAEEQAKEDRYQVLLKERLRMRGVVQRCRLISESARRELVRAESGGDSIEVDYSRAKSAAADDAYAAALAERAATDAEFSALSAHHARIRVRLFRRRVRASAPDSPAPAAPAPAPAAAPGPLSPEEVEALMMQLADQALDDYLAQRPADPVPAPAPKPAAPAAEPSIAARREDRTAGLAASAGIHDVLRYEGGFDDEGNAPMDPALLEELDRRGREAAEADLAARREEERRMEEERRSAAPAADPLAVLGDWGVPSPVFESDDLCGVCYLPCHPGNPRVDAACGHNTCSDCYGRWCQTHAEQNGGIAIGAPCPVCRGAVNPVFPPL